MPALRSKESEWGSGRRAEAFLPGRPPGGRLPAAGWDGSGSRGPEESPVERPTGRSVLSGTDGSYETTAGHAVARRRGPSADRAAEPGRRSVTDPEPDMDGGRASVRNVRSKCRCSHVLQFTFRRAVCCVLHRPPSQVIHCTVLSLAAATLHFADALRSARLPDLYDDGSRNQHGECGYTRERPFLGRRARGPDGAPLRPRATWQSRGRLCEPRTKGPEVRARTDNRPALPRPVPAAAESAWRLRPSGRRAGAGRLASRRAGRPDRAQRAQSVRLTDSSSRPLMILLQVHLQ